MRRALDVVDFRLLSSLFGRPFASHAALGRDLGVSAPTVSRRLEALRQSGIYHGLAAYPHALALGRHEVTRAFPSYAGSCGDLVELPDVVWAARRHDGSVVVCQYMHQAPGGFQEEDDALARAVGAASIEEYRFPSARPGAGLLSRVEARVVGALVQAPAAGVDALAEASGLSPKTVRKHRDALWGDGRLEVYPIVSPAASTGLVTFHLLVSLDSPGATPDDVRAAVPGAVVVSELATPPSLWLFCHAANMLEHERIRARVAALPGVASCRTVLTEGFAVAVPRLVAWLDGVADGVRG